MTSKRIRIVATTFVSSLTMFALFGATNHPHASGAFLILAVLCLLSLILDLIWMD